MLTFYDFLKVFVSKIGNIDWDPLCFSHSQVDRSQIETPNLMMPNLFKYWWYLFVFNLTNVLLIFVLDVSINPSQNLGKYWEGVRPTWPCPWWFHKSRLTSCINYSCTNIPIGYHFIRPVLLIKICSVSSLSCFNYSYAGFRIYLFCTIPHEVSGGKCYVLALLSHFSITFSVFRKRQIISCIMYVIFIKRHCHVI